jgi:hypothetical protein
MADRDRSAILPTDPFDLQMESLTGLPHGAHTSPSIVQAADFYGNTTQFIVQSIRNADGGAVAFVTQVNAQGSLRYVLPPEVLRVIDRQRDSITTQLRRRQGQRLAESQTPEQREAAAARLAKARRARKAGR